MNQFLRLENALLSLAARVLCKGADGLRVDLTTRGMSLVRADVDPAPDAKQRYSETAVLEVVFHDEDLSEYLAYQEYAANKRRDRGDQKAGRESTQQ